MHDQAATCFSTCISMRTCSTRQQLGYDMQECFWFLVSLSSSTMHTHMRDANIGSMLRTPRAHLLLRGRDLLHLQRDEFVHPAPLLFLAVVLDQPLCLRLQLQLYASLPLQIVLP